MSALRRGFVFAALATIAFGITTPVIAVIGTGAGPWSTAGWLYIGGAAFACAAQRQPRGLLIGLRSHWPLLVAIAAVGGMLAPAAYIAGLRSAGPLATSLTLNMEAPFSAALAAIFFREYLGRRAIAALALIVAGTSALALGDGTAGLVGFGASGLLLVLLATALWAVDNALTSRLPDLDPRVTIFWKGALGGTLSLLLGRVLHENVGPPRVIFIVLLIGAAGYGASLLFYLIAQRQFGVARTASVFAVSPFIGAAGSLLAGNTRPTLLAGGAAIAMLAGVWLHFTERHRHEHEHPPLDHDHLHRHDDLHHDHPHASNVSGEHHHRHVHEGRLHTHDHAPDSEHTHRH